MDFMNGAAMRATLAILFTFCLALSGCSNRCTSNPLAPTWQKVIPDKSGYLLSQGTDGGFVIGGGVTGEDGYSFSPFLAKTDSDGEEQWSIDLVAEGFTRLGGVAEGTDGIVLVAGYGPRSALVAGVDSNGEPIWSLPLDELDGDEYFVQSSLVMTSDGDGVFVYLAESEEAFVLDTKIVKFGPDGTIRWRQTLEIDQSAAFADLAPTEDGGVTLLVVDFEDDFFKGASKLTPAPPQRTRLIRLADDGATRWDVLTPREFDYSYNIAAAKDDGLVLLANDRIARFNMNGGIDWVKALALEHNNGLFGLSPTLRTVPGDGFVIGGSSFSLFVYSVVAAQTCGNSVLVKLDDEGNVEWEREYGTSAVEFLEDFLPTGNGRYTVLGGTNISPNGDFRDTLLMEVNGADLVE